MGQISILKNGIRKSRIALINVERPFSISFEQNTDNKLMQLIERIKNGDIEAMETLTISYMHIVINIANDFKGNGLTYFQLIIKGNSGLIKAAENFNESRGIDFNAYAMWTVRRAILQSIDEQELNKPLPLNKIGLITRKNQWNKSFSETEIYTD